jgi:hypothetical protein
VALALVLDAVVGSSASGSVCVLPLSLSSGRSELQADGGGDYRRAASVHGGDDLFAVDASSSRRCSSFQHYVPTWAGGQPRYGRLVSQMSGTRRG